ncbi:MAG TPA: hypothetical protein PKD64_06805 [Pirellulaceae bacterium]|mgnify:CR=1 FL=1|nr:hypothetical protein [Pirellulaceae bacterium]HMO91892.1 hypothetical protein [Pirellulaceae bacterium]HMP68692.1 hypothetical protein [Pirellulaceae bacterium]
MHLYQSCTIMVIVLVAVGGCRNCNQCWRPNPMAGLGSPVISPPGFAQQTPAPANPYYGTTLPALPAGNSTSTVPALPASNMSPGWRPAGQQVPSQPASFNQTNYQPSTGYLQIPMNNVVSSTQTSTLRPHSQLADSQPASSNVIVASTVPQITGQTVSLGMPVNDATQSGSSPANPQRREIAGSYQFNTGVTRPAQVLPPNNQGISTANQFYQQNQPTLPGNSSTNFNR